MSAPNRGLQTTQPAQGGVSIEDRVRPHGWSPGVLGLRRERVPRPVHLGGTSSPSAGGFELLFCFCLCFPFVLRMCCRSTDWMQVGKRSPVRTPAPGSAAQLAGTSCFRPTRLHTLAKPVMPRGASALLAEGPQAYSKTVSCLPLPLSPPDGSLGVLSVHREASVLPPRQGGLIPTVHTPFVIQMLCEA